MPGPARPAATARSSGPLTLAGVPASDAVAATLLYRLFSCWLPIPLGSVAYLLFRRRYPERRGPPPDGTA